MDAVGAGNTKTGAGTPAPDPEKVDRRLHPHAKPADLISRLIGAVTRPGDLIVDPCAGGFTVLHEARRLNRSFLGVDIAWVAP
jgi:site-specific DNA-methyltransferase (adenine-specific)